MCSWVFSLAVSVPLFFQPRLSSVFLLVNTTFTSELMRVNLEFLSLPFRILSFGVTLLFVCLFWRRFAPARCSSFIPVKTEETQRLRIAMLIASPIVYDYVHLRSSLFTNFNCFSHGGARIRRVMVLATWDLFNCLFSQHSDLVRVESSSSFVDVLHLGSDPRAAAEVQNDCESHACKILTLSL